MEASQRIDDTFGRLVAYLNRLDRSGIHYGLAHTRPESIMIDVAIPGWRWEIEFMTDGSVEIERYQSVGGVENDDALLDDLIHEAE